MQSRRKFLCTPERKNSPSFFFYLGWNREAYSYWKHSFSDTKRKDARAFSDCGSGKLGISSVLPKRQSQTNDLPIGSSTTVPLCHSPHSQMAKGLLFFFRIISVNSACAYEA